MSYNAENHVTYMIRQDKAVNFLKNKNRLVSSSLSDGIFLAVNKNYFASAAFALSQSVANPASSKIAISARIFLLISMPLFLSPSIRRL